MQLKHSPGCNCCGCLLWMSEFRSAYSDTKPSDKQYFHQLSRIAIREGVVGHGLQFQLFIRPGNIREWNAVRQWTVPVLDQHPNVAAIQAMIAGDGSQPNTVYHYYLLELGLRVLYVVRVSTGRELGVTPPIPLAIAPWQNKFTHLTSAGLQPANPGTLLSLGESIVTKGNLPNSHWYFAIRNGIDPNGPVQTPYWLGVVGSGILVEIYSTNSAGVETIKATFEFKRVTPLQLNVAYFDEWGLMPDGVNNGADIVGLATVTIDGVAMGDFWVPSIATLGFQHPEIAIGYIPGMIALRAFPRAYGNYGHSGRQFVLELPTGLVKAAGTAIQIPPVACTSPLDAFSGLPLWRPTAAPRISQITWPLQLSSPVKVRIKPVGTATIIAGLLTGGTKLIGYGTEIVPSSPPDDGDGYRLTQDRDLDCPAYVACGAVYPHGQQEWRLQAMTCTGVTFDIDQVAVIYDECTTRLATKDLTARSNRAFQNYRSLFLVVGSGATRFVRSPPFDPTSLITVATNTEVPLIVTEASFVVPSGLTVTHDSPAAPFVSVRVTVTNDGTDAEYVYVTATVIVKLLGVKFGTHLGSTWPILNSSPSLPARLVLSLNGTRRTNPATGNVDAVLPAMQLDASESSGVFRKRVPRWIGLQPPTIAFSAADILSYTAGSDASKTINMKGEIAWTEGSTDMTYTPALSNPLTWDFRNIEFTVGPSA